MSAVPIRLTIPSLRISAPVVPVGVDATGDMQIPARISDVGWYRWGPAPSDGAGSIVLAGHVDSARDGLGAFFTLRAIRVGATITVTLASGQHRTYRVIGREIFDKKNVPLGALFSRTGPERLTLITCGGSFNRSKRSYVDNIVVTAVPS